LPVGPVAQEVVALESPVPVEDTAEVVEAKAIHFKAIEDAKNGIVAPLPVVEAVELPQSVEDTPEVAAAKAEHAAAHAAALAAANASPVEDTASPALERKRRQIPFYPFPYFAASQRGADYAWRSVDADKDGQPDVPAVVSYVAPVVPAMTYTIPNTPFRYYN